MSGQFWISTWFLHLPISKLMAMKLLALWLQVNCVLDLFIGTNLWVFETWFHPLLLCVSLRHPSIIPTVKEWKECACIFNSDNCATACIYGAEKCYSPVAADGWGQFNGCLYSEVTSTCVKETEVTWLLPGYIQLWADLPYVLLSCKVPSSSFGGWLPRQGDQFYLYDCY